MIVGGEASLLREKAIRLGHALDVVESRPAGCPGEYPDGPLDSHYEDLARTCADEDLKAVLSAIKSQGRGHVNEVWKLENLHFYQTCEKVGDWHARAEAKAKAKTKRGR